MNNEDIKVLEESYVMKTNHELDENNKRVRQAIENLIKRNKDLEERNKKLDRENQGLFEAYNFNDTNLLAKTLKEYRKEILNSVPKSKVTEKIEEIEKQGIWIDEDYYYNEELGEEYPICKKEFTKEELEEVVIDILNKLQEGDNNETNK